MQRILRRMIEAGALASMLAVSAEAGNRPHDLEAPLPPQDAVVTEAPVLSGEPPRSCENGKGWALEVPVEPAEIAYRVRDGAMIPGNLKQETVDRIVSENQCMSLILDGPQRSECRYNDRAEQYLCTARRFIQITKRDGGEWTEPDILKTVSRFAKVSCCIAYSEPDAAVEPESQS